MLKYDITFEEKMKNDIDQVSAGLTPVQRFGLRAVSKVYTARESKTLSEAEKELRDKKRSIS